MDQEIVFCEGSEGKEAFLDHKNIDFKKPPKCAFPWFVSKNGDFLIFSFYAKWIKK